MVNKNEGELRRVHAIGTSRFVSLPASWAKKYGIDKGDEVVVKSNDVVIIAPKVDFKVKVEADVIWFIEGEKKAGLRRENVKIFVERYGIDKTANLIKEELKKRGFSPAIPNDAIERNIAKLVFEFVEG